MLGEFHSSDEDTVIPLGWVEQAVERWHTWDAAGRPGRAEYVTVGVDVARSGRDQTVLAPRFGNAIDDLIYSHREDTMQTTGRVVELLRRHHLGKAVVDVIGIGAGVVDRLREQGFEVVAFNAGEGTTVKDRTGEMVFLNKRAAAWWSMREWLDPLHGENVALPPDDLMIGDLTAPTWRLTSSGKIQVEAKDDIIERLGRSPDAGDSVIQAFWEDAGAGPVKVARMDDRRLTTGRRAR